ncbi:hypothetical protein SAMN04515647_2800 [Cohaesibacter sp. ES.047]|nr:hypothetical protein SAMN04515647_2800 [Cohaesibacter sp. ES.047]
MNEHLFPHQRYNRLKSLRHAFWALVCSLFAPSICDTCNCSK